MPSEATIKRFMLRAREAAKRSTYPKQSIGAVLVYGNKILATGCNTNKTNPTQKRYNIERGYDQNVKNNGICHAEMQILLKTKFLDIDWDKTTLYVYRELKNGTIGCAKPCPACEKAIKETRISLTVDTAGPEIQEVTNSFLNGFIRFILNHKIRKVHRININFLAINNCKMVVHNLIVSHAFSPFKVIKL